jgi:hypothetical protein
MYLSAPLFCTLSVLEAGLQVARYHLRAVLLLDLGQTLFPAITGPNTGKKELCQRIIVSHD